jgi:hypothetical protein
MYVCTEEESMNLQRFGDKVLSETVFGLIIAFTVSIFSVLWVVSGQGCGLGVGGGLGGRHVQNHRGVMHLHTVTFGVGGTSRTTRFRHGVSFLLLIVIIVLLLAHFLSDLIGIRIDHYLLGVVLVGGVVEIISRIFVIVALAHLNLCWLKHCLVMSNKHLYAFKRCFISIDKFSR